MRRPVVLLVTMALALATAVALMGVAAALTASPLAGGRSDLGQGDEAANTEVVRAFYAAANDILRNGNPGALDRLVAADLVEHPAGPVGDGRAGLARRLAALHAAFPAARFMVEDLISQGDAVLAWVRLQGAEPGAFLGMPVPTELTGWGPLEVSRVSEGRIVERWASREVPVLLEPLVEAPLAVPAQTPAELLLARYTYAPGAAWPMDPDPFPRLLVVQEGRIAVEVEGPDLVTHAPRRHVRHGEADVQTSELTLEAGDLFLLPAGSSAVAHNDGAPPAVVLQAAVVLVRPLTPGTDAPNQPAPAPGVVPQPLPAAVVAAGAPVLMVGRATLAPEVTFPVPAATDLHVLAVETGTLDPHCGASDAAAAQPTGMESWTPISLGAGCGLHNGGDGPLTVLVLRVYRG